jgi:hypothetical protein
MKKIALVSAIALGSLFYNKANAQILQIGLRLGGHHPVVEASLAAPVAAVSYSNADDYYYLPDVDAYYCVPERVYYYNNGYNWVSAASLPGEYSNYDWRAARHYEVRAARPFLRADFYRDRYNGRAYDWRSYNNRNDNRYDARRDDRYGNRYDRRQDDRFNNRRDDRYNQQPVFTRPYNQPRGGEHADDGNRNWNRGDRGNDNRQQNYDRPQRPAGNWQQNSDQHFASNQDRGRHGFGF